MAYRPWTLPDFDCRIPPDNNPRLNIPKHGGSGTDYCSFTDGHAGSHKGSGCDPSVRLHRDRFADQHKIRTVYVVTGRAQIGVLRN
jgi:hypothetical protein